MERARNASEKSIIFFVRKLVLEILLDLLYAILDLIYEYLILQ